MEKERKVKERKVKEKGEDKQNRKIKYTNIKLPGMHINIEQFCHFLYFS
jgi:hypothetical protein